MKTLMTILASVGLSMLIMYFLIRKHNIDYHKKNCPCKKRLGVSGNGTPIVSTAIDDFLNPIVDPIIDNAESPTDAVIKKVGDVLKEFNIEVK